MNESSRIKFGSSLLKSSSSTQNVQKRSTTHIVLPASDGDDKYIVTKELLGKGSFSHVHRGYIQRLEPIAVKKIRLDRVKKQNANLESEITILQSLKHKNIVNLMDVVKKDGKIYLIFE